MPPMFTCQQHYSHIFSQPLISQRLKGLLDLRMGAIFSGCSGSDNNSKITLAYSDKLYKEACEKYIGEMRFRWQMRRLLATWLRRRIDMKSVDTTDLVTLQPIVAPIHVYDMQARRRYAFEARTCSQAIHAALSYSREGFSQPQQPKNLYTNMPFTYVQLISIDEQLKSAGLQSWLLGAFREYNFRLEYYSTIMNRSLTINALKSELRTNSEHCHEILIGFIEYSIYEHDLPDSAYIVRLFKTALEVVPSHPLIQSFKLLAYADYEAEILNMSRSIFITYMAKNLLDKIHILEDIPEIAEKL